MYLYIFIWIFIYIIHRLIDHLSWKRPQRSSPTTKPALPSLSLNPVPKHHIHTNVYLFFTGK